MCGTLPSSYLCLQTGFNHSDYNHDKRRHHHHHDHDESHHRHHNHEKSVHHQVKQPLIEWASFVKKYAHRESWIQFQGWRGRHCRQRDVLGQVGQISISICIFIKFKEKKITSQIIQKSIFQPRDDGCQGLLVTGNACAKPQCKTTLCDIMLCGTSCDIMLHVTFL